MVLFILLTEKLRAERKVIARKQRRKEFRKNAPDEGISSEPKQENLTLIWRGKLTNTGIKCNTSQVTLIPR